MADNPETAAKAAAAAAAPSNIQQMVATKRLQQAQAQVGEVVDIMRVNVEKVLERDQKLSELDRRADDLQEGASQFQQQTDKLKRKAWWENAKIWLILGVVLVVVVLIIVINNSAKGNNALKKVDISKEETPDNALDADLDSASLNGQEDKTMTHLDTSNLSSSTSTHLDEEKEQTKGQEIEGE